MLLYAIFAVASIAIIICLIPFKRNSPSKYFREVENQMAVHMKNQFSVSEYYDRMEKAGLAVLEEQKPVDQTIILWRGLDGLRLNEDGSLEWISRKKPEKEPERVYSIGGGGAYFYHPQQMILPAINPMSYYPTIRCITAKGGYRMEWISVKDRPVPDDDKRYIVFAHYHEKHVVECTKGWAVGTNVTHWMPLPEPPKDD